MFSAISRQPIHPCADLTAVKKSVKRGVTSSKANIVRSSHASPWGPRGGPWGHIISSKHRHSAPHHTPPLHGDGGGGRVWRSIALGVVTSTLRLTLRQTSSHRHIVTPPRATPPMERPWRWGRMGVNWEDLHAHALLMSTLVASARYRRRRIERRKKEVEATQKPLKNKNMTIPYRIVTPSRQYSYCPLVFVLTPDFALPPIGPRTAQVTRLLLGILF